MITIFVKQKKWQFPCLFLCFSFFFVVQFCFVLFYYLLNAPGTVFNTQSQEAIIRYETHAMMNLTRTAPRDDSAINFNHVEMTFIFPVHISPIKMTNKSGENPGVPEETPHRRAADNATHKTPKLQALVDPRRRNVTTSIAGLKKRSHAQKSHPIW